MPDRRRSFPSPPATRRLALALALVVACSLVRAEGPAPSLHTEAIDLDGAATSLDVYLPAAGAPLGAAIVAHGWTRSKAQHRDQGFALADANVVAIVPDLPNVLDLWGNGTLIVDLVARLEAGALGLPPMPRSSIVLVGTSAGGLATVFAASKLPGIAGWVGLDPVDRTGTGLYAASKLDAPAIVLLGDSSACNLFGSGRSIARAAPHLVRATKIDGASHCAFESPTSSFCTRLCGRASPERQSKATRETVAASLELLRRARGPEAAPQRERNDGEEGAPRPAPAEVPADVPRDEPGRPRSDEPLPDRESAGGPARPPVGV